MNMLRRKLQKEQATAQKEFSTAINRLRKEKGQMHWLNKGTRAGWAWAMDAPYKSLSETAGLATELSIDLNLDWKHTSLPMNFHQTLRDLRKTKGFVYEKFTEGFYKAILHFWK